MIKSVFVFALCFGCALAHAEDIAWMTDEKAAFAKAKAEKELVMVNVSAKGDQLSTRFNDSTLTNPEVVALAKHVVALKCDPTKEGRSMALKFNVNVYPTILFLAPDGHMVSKLVGYETGTDFVDTFTVALDSFKDFDAVKAEATSNPRDGEANAKMATFLSAQVDPTLRQEPVGEPYLQRALASRYKGPYLLLALEAVGDGYAMLDGKTGVAISYYEKALALAKSPAQKAKAMIALVYLQEDTNKAAAMALAQKIVDLKDAPPEWAYEAKVAIDDMNKKG